MVQVHQVSEGRIACVVTGHTRGLGAAIGAELLARGARVLGIARSDNAVLHERGGERLQQVRLDLSDTRALLDWIAGGALARFLGDCERTALINNAGVLAPIGPAGTREPAEIARALAVNVVAPILLTEAFVAASAQAADRRVLHVSSGAARNPYSGWSVYCASKAALNQHARAVATERIPHLGIAAVAPGVVDTDMQALIRASSPAAFPQREKFVALAQGGALTPPAQAARRMVDHLLGDGFGAQTVVDLRERW